ncbi:hypothetical protein ACFX2F_005783 [Malus domestica]
MVRSRGIGQWRRPTYGDSEELAEEALMPWSSSSNRKGSCRRVRSSPEEAWLQGESVMRVSVKDGYDFVLLENLLSLCSSDINLYISWKGALAIASLAGANTHVHQAGQQPFWCDVYFSSQSRSSFAYNFHST